MAADHRDLRASNHDDNHLPTDEICTIMCSEPSNVTNPVDGYISNFALTFPEQVERCTCRQLTITTETKAYANEPGNIQLL